jgi:hypothetical protein
MVFLLLLMLLLAALQTSPGKKPVMRMMSHPNELHAGPQLACDPSPARPRLRVSTTTTTTVTCS